MRTSIEAQIFPVRMIASNCSKTNTEQKVLKLQVQKKTRFTKGVKENAMIHSKVYLFICIVEARDNFLSIVFFCLASPVVSAPATIKQIKDKQKKTHTLPAFGYS